MAEVDFMSGRQNVLFVFKVKSEGGYFLQMNAFWHMAGKYNKDSSVLVNSFF